MITLIRRTQKLIAIAFCFMIAITFSGIGNQSYAASNSPFTAETISVGKTISGSFPTGTADDAYHYYKFKTGNVPGMKYTLKVSNTSVEGSATRRLEYSIIDSNYLDSEDVSINTSNSFAGYYYGNGGYIMYLWETGETGSMKYTNLKKNSEYYVKVKLDNYLSTKKANTYAFQIVAEKPNNPLKVKARTAVVKHTKLKKKNQTVATSKLIVFTKKGQGKISYKKVSGNKRIVINAKTGKVTVKKGLKKGTYKMKVKVKAAGNTNYKAATKTLTLTIKIR